MLHSWYCIDTDCLDFFNLNIALHWYVLQQNNSWERMPLGCQYHQGYEYHPKTIDFPLKEYDIGQWLGSSDISEQDTLTSLLIGKNGSAEAVASIISDSLPLKSQVWQVNSRLMTTEVLTHWAHEHFPFLWSLINRTVTFDHVFGRSLEHAGMDCKAYFSIRSCYASGIFMAW